MINSATGLVFSDNAKNYSSDYKNIFVPVSDADNKEYLDESKVQFPKYGQQFGELSIASCNVDTKLFFGDGNIALRNGVGVYNGSSIPGFGTTILIAGHNNTDFNGLKKAKKGQIVKVRTSYGNYTYEVTGTAVKSAKANDQYDLNSKVENLVMYTCYPFDELGLTSRRYFVYAKYVSGPQVKTAEGGE